MISRPLFRARAVFSDETEAYRRPAFPRYGEETEVRVRCLAGNADEASAVFRPLSASGWTRIPLSVRETVNGFDHYGGIIPAADGPVLY